YLGREPPEGRRPRRPGSPAPRSATEGHAAPRWWRAPAAPGSSASSRPPSGCRPDRQRPPRWAGRCRAPGTGRSLEGPAPGGRRDEACSRGPAGCSEDALPCTNSFGPARMNRGQESLGPEGGAEAAAPYSMGLIATTLTSDFGGSQLVKGVVFYEYGSSSEIQGDSPAGRERLLVEVASGGQILHRNPQGFEEGHLVVGAASGDLALQHVAQLALDVGVVDRTVGAGEQEISGLGEQRLPAVGE